MIEVRSEKKAVTYQSVTVDGDYDFEENRKVVNVYGKNYFVISAYISENWDVTEGAPKETFAKVRLVSILTNGKVGNKFQTLPWVSKTAYNDAFKELFEAYEQEVSKVTQEVAVA
jgi:hypothetical protein